MDETAQMSGQQAAAAAASLSSADDIKGALDIARRDLLDLTFNNPLLNFRPLKARGAEIIDERAVEVFRILVMERKRMRLASSAQGTTDPGAPDDGDILEKYIAGQMVRTGDSDEVLAQHQDLCLQTPYEPAALERRVLNTAYAARSTIEEQGVNTLFLALGMLKWRDPSQPDRTFFSPLVLVPVSLERSDVKSKFAVACRGEEDVMFNICLQEKLSLDFGIQWPGFSEDGELDLAAYFKQAGLAVKDMPDWQVCRDAIHLCFVSFHKFVMYQDLDATKWPAGAPLTNQELIRALLGRDNFRHAGANLPAEGMLDDILPPDKVCHVVDTDSSQAIALAEAATGKHMVIQGPPGTGKSQTITNLIAQAVESGKTVLFVSEKMAALEVVNRRLARIGLGDICLVLHSSTTSKRALLDDLRSVWELGRPAGADADKNLLQLATLIRELGGHACAVNEPIGKSGRSAYQVMGRLLQLDKELADTEPSRLQVDGWLEWNGEQFGSATEKAAQLQALLEDTGDLRTHPFRDARVCLLTQMDLPVLRKNILAACDIYDSIDRSIKSLQEQLGDKWSMTFADAVEAAQLLMGLSSWPDLTGVLVENHAWQSEKANIDDQLRSLGRLQQLRATWDEVLKEAVWEAPGTKDAAACLASYAGKWTRWFAHRYRTARAQARACWRGRPPWPDAQLLQGLQAVLEARSLASVLSENERAMQQLFGDQWQGRHSRVAVLQRMADVLCALHTTKLPADVRHAVLASAAGEAGAQVAALGAALRRDLAEYESRLLVVLKQLDCKGSTTGTTGEMWAHPLGVQRSVLERWNRDAERLLPMARLNALAAQLEANGLASLVAAARTWPEAVIHLSRLLERSWLQALLEAWFREHPELQGLARSVADQRVSRFRRADRQVFDHNRRRVLTTHYENIPRRDAGGEVAILSHEIEKKSRHKPIRVLMHQAGRALQRAKPVFMMSPFSVSAYLPKGELTFDLVVFDEASQVKPVDAFGAIARGRQVVVVGDDKQLPPTSFFDTILGDDAVGARESETADIESILGLFNARGAFSTMLRWHYRSRHHSLIRFSNHHFYGDNLTVFPSPDSTNRVQGLSFVHVTDGVYLRGSARARNPVEARRVAEAVMEHARRTPEKTLGVAAFSMSQMQEILDNVEILRRQNSDCEPFFARHPEEPFFVKNLETVQGDERDVIFISVGYGRDEQGRVAMNFGPLNRDGGQRRLNVLITRAKERCVVFSNLTADDLDDARCHAPGVLALKGYLAYAERGEIELSVAQAREPDSPFEVEVAAALRERGHQVVHQVGTAGYFIDLAVVDPEQPGRFILGIECDGASYHRSRWARDRDRLRQELLEGLGWRIHRIWSGCWFDDPKTELARVEEALRSQPGPAAVPPDDGSVKPVAREQSPEDARRGKDVKYRLTSITNGPQGADLAVVDHAAVVRAIEKIVKVEGPIHLRVVLDRLSESTGGTRLVSRVCDSVAETVRHMASRQLLRQDGEYLWPLEMTDAPIRNRKDVTGAARDLTLVPPQEIRGALRAVVEEALSIEPEELFRITLERLGLGSLRGQRRELLLEALEACVQAGELERIAGRVVMGSGGGGR